MFLFMIPVKYTGIFKIKIIAWKSRLVRLLKHITSHSTVT